MRRSFKDEDMASRRLFLRSYPLRWEDEGEELGDEFSLQDEILLSTKKKHCNKVKSLIKNSVMEILNWGEDKLLLLKKIKDEASMCLVISCHPCRFKNPAKLFRAA